MCINFGKDNHLKKFQKSINEHNKEIYYKLRLNKNISEEERIVANIAIHEFQKIILKWPVFLILKRKILVYLLVIIAVIPHLNLLRLL